MTHTYIYMIDMIHVYIYEDMTQTFIYMIHVYM
jgi:hypothetical protein